MIVCLCHRISDREIVQAARDGVTEFEALQDETCLSRNCGCCEAVAREIFEAACADAGACAGSCAARRPVATPTVVTVRRAEPAPLQAAA
ncbi:bacterioferritin-associated ferredoxin [Aquabacterium sp. J223]|uniref:(2Fe-2S)-binding protein n=1 Tax=Aquabacterium sp. J223 TaxID=2898431 RepID=UPI0021ADF9D4|nr:(2Fe-2S)-binding protein [Aquabacterium sp. J223]UUX95635.1 (2Fe-2S)-binding protein [Aquabacterium sp. J223]